MPRLAPSGQLGCRSMRKSWFKDFFAPSNLWNAAQWLSPAGTAAVSSWLSYLWSLPPSVNLMLALVSAAAMLVLISELRRNSLAGKVVIHQLSPVRFVWNQTTQTGFVQLCAIFKNNDPVHRAFYRLETLNHAIQGHACEEGASSSDLLEVPPLGVANYVFFSVHNIRLGPIYGILRYRMRYGKYSGALSLRREEKISLKGNVFIDASGKPHFDLNWFIEETNE